jgi:hypothetical protein
MTDWSPPRRPALFALQFLAVPAMADTFAFDLSGITPEGQPYRGTAEVSLEGPSCHVVWRSPDPLEGVCMVNDGRLIASYDDSGRRGHALYDPQPDGSLSGVWAVDGLPGVGVETLVPAGQTPVAPAGRLDDEARALLEQFLKPGADLQALTESLAPRRQDIHEVYGDPLATALEPYLATTYGSGEAIAPQPGQTELQRVVTTTGALRSDPAVLAEFPGGYADVLSNFTADVPIARFKFVAPGEDLGMAFDGLLHVNGRLVLIPKPWRALP